VLYCHSITKITRNGIKGAMFVTEPLELRECGGHPLYWVVDQ